VVSAAGNVIVEQGIADEFPVRQFPDVWLTQIPVLDQPLDDIGVVEN
jgi:hypothetical protein